MRRREQEKQKPLCTIPEQYVVRSVRPERDSDFTAWLGTIILPETVRLLVKEYRIGVTKAGDVIFFQLDFEGR